MATTTKKVTKPMLKKSPTASNEKTARSKPQTTPTAKPAPRAESGAHSTSAKRLAALSTEAGTALLDLAKQTPDAEGAKTIARAAEALAKGEPVDNKALAELRDTVNTLAATLRAADKLALAKQYSRANRAVRRLERASRRAS